MINKDLINKIYDSADELLNSVIAYVKSQGGFIDCQSGVMGEGDIIYAYDCYGGISGADIEEKYVYAVRLDEDDDLYACIVPCTRTYKERWTREDYDRTFNDFENDYHWCLVNRNSEALLFVDTIINIAECIEEYGE